MTKTNPTYGDLIAQRRNLERQIIQGGTSDQLAEWNHNLCEAKRTQAVRISEYVTRIRTLDREANPPQLACWKERRDALGSRLVNHAFNGGDPHMLRANKKKLLRRLDAVQVKLERVRPAAKGLVKATAELSILVALTRNDPDAGPRMRYTAVVQACENMKQWRNERREHLPTALSAAKRVLRSHGYNPPMDGESEGESDGDDTIAEDSDDDDGEHGAEAEESYLNDNPSNGAQDRKSGAPTTA